MNRLDLKFGFDCNNRCVFCVQGDKRETERRKTTEELEAALREKRATCQGVVFTGGEVTLRKDLLPMVELARQLGYQSIQIQTNGRMLSYAPYVDKLLAAGATEFAPAIHGPDAATHDALVRAKGAFVQTVRGIEHARRRGARVVLNSVIVQQNYKQLPDTARLFVHLGVQQYQFAFVHALGTAEQYFPQVVPRYQELAPYLHEALLIGEAAGLRVMTEAVPFCWMRGFERFVAERIMPETAIVDGDHEIESYADYRWNEGKAHGPPCDQCQWPKACEGPWREYPARFGWDEFKARDDDPALVLEAQPPQIGKWG